MLKQGMGKPMKTQTKLMILPLIAVLATGCSRFKGADGGESTVVNVSEVPMPKQPIIAGLGDKFSGKGALSVPTAEATVARIQVGLENKVSPLTGNFATALAQVKGNLPKVTDPTTATGYDQLQLLVYAACSDLTTGATPLMTSFYTVPATGTIMANQTALIAAGTRMLDQHAAGLASGGSASAEVKQTLTDLVQKIAATSTNTTKIAFMSVCIAANTAGTALLGF